MTKVFLNEALSYDQDTGVLRWKEDRPLYHFKSEHGHKVWRARYAGKIAGTDSHGYLQARVSGKHIRVHRIAWIMTHGDIPANLQIDHINGVKSDNRIDNLRLATNADNQCNSVSRSNNTSGTRGVSFHKISGKWVAQISIGGRVKNLGAYDTIGDAAQVYRNASIKHHGRFSPFAKQCK